MNVRQPTEAGVCPETNKRSLDRAAESMLNALWHIRSTRRPDIS